MNVLLWSLQIALAVLYFSGGLYKIFASSSLAGQVGVLPQIGWIVLGAIEVAGSLLVVIPTGGKWMPVVVPVAAAVLTVETLGLALVYAGVSTELTAANPFGWAAGMAVFAAVVALGRYARPVRAN